MLRRFELLLRPEFEVEQVLSFDPSITSVEYIERMLFHTVQVLVGMFPPIKSALDDPGPGLHC
jgi:hypothetical protein